VRTGESAGGRANREGIVGVKGRWNFGAENNWLELYHPEFGSGESDFARQEMASIGYAGKRWGVVASCRSLADDIGTGRPFSSPSPNGP
jgi:hypothetical protein